MSVLSGSLTTGHVGLCVTDLKSSTAFYKKVFGLRVIDEAHEKDRAYVFLGDGHRLVLTLWPQASRAFGKSNAGLHHLSFELASAEDMRAAERKLREFGVEILHGGPVAHADGVDSGGIFFLDPDGIRLELYAPSGMKAHPAPAGAAPACGFF